MEASALQAPATLPQTKLAMGTPLLRFRSDEQLLALFRAGYDEAFRAIHDRYHKRLFAYARQMLPGRQDAEDALQDVFVRAYAGLRATDHELALRAWLFRVAHNRCIDELRRPAPPPPELLHLVRSTVHDPLAEVDLRESLRRLIEDIRRLPEQQRSALLMRELGGMTYADLSTSLGISIGAVKSLLVRARVALAQAAEARDTSCILIREQLVEAHDRGIRPNATTRRHMRDCVGCKCFRRELRGMSRQLAAVAPAVGPLAILGKTLGFSGGAKGGAAGGGGLALLGGGGATASAGGVAVGVNHVATLLVAAVATAGGAVELQHTIIAPPHRSAQDRVAARHRHHRVRPAAAPVQTAIQAIAGDVEATISTAPNLAADAPSVTPIKPKLHHKISAGGAGLSPATGASRLASSHGTAKTGAAGITGLESAASSACTELITPGPSTTSSGSSTSSGTGTSSSGSGGTSSTTGTTPSTTTPPANSGTSSATTATTAQCPGTTSTSPGSPSTAASTNSSGSGSGTSGANTGSEASTGTGTGGGSTGSSASGTSASSSGSGSSSPSTASSSGSTSPSK